MFNFRRFLPFPSNKNLDHDLLGSSLPDSGQRNRLQTSTNRKELYPHQLNAVNKILLSFETSDRTQLIHACGTGKTITATAIVEQLKAKNTVVIEPTLALISQNIKEFIEQLGRDQYDYLIVASDKNILVGQKKVDGLDEQDISVDELEEYTKVKVTNDPDEINAFLNSDPTRKKIVFSTLQSSNKLSEGTLKQGNEQFSFDLMVVDESHTLATRDPEESLHNTPLFDEKIFARKRLFMTATPVLITLNTSDEEEVVFSMNNEKLFGKVSDTITFEDAINEGLISDYEVVIAVMREGESLEHESLRKINLTPHLVGILQLEKLLKGEKPVTKVMSFHSSVTDAREFSELLDENNIQEILKKKDNIWVASIDSSQPIRERNGVLRTFDSLKKNVFAVLSSCMCIGTGTNVPSVDAGMFFGKCSVVNTIQRVGRIVRKSSNLENSNVKIIVPILLTNSDELSASSSAALESVLGALSSHDTRLRAELENSETNSRGSYSYDPERFKVVGMGSISKKISETRILEQVRLKFYNRTQLKKHLLTEELIVKYIGKYLEEHKILPPIDSTEPISLDDSPIKETPHSLNIALINRSRGIKEDSPTSLRNLYAKHFPEQFGILTEKRLVQLVENYKKFNNNELPDNKSIAVDNKGKPIQIFVADKPESFERIYKYIRRLPSYDSARSLAKYKNFKDFLIHKFPREFGMLTPEWLNEYIQYTIENSMEGFPNTRSKDIIDHQDAPKGKNALTFRKISQRYSNSKAGRDNWLVEIDGYEWPATFGEYLNENYPTDPGILTHDLIQECIVNYYIENNRFPNRESGPVRHNKAPEGLTFKRIESALVNRNRGITEDYPKSLAKYKKAYEEEIEDKINKAQSY